MSSLALLVLTASLVGSVHCAGMCGGFVAFYTGAQGGDSNLRAHAAYNAGRLVAYASLGSLAGALGGLVDAAGRMAGLSRVAAVLAGSLMVLWGAWMVLPALGVRVVALRTPAALTRSLGGVLRRLRDSAAWLRAAGLGLATGLIPCGFLYAFVVTAATTGDAYQGAAVMAFFWAGTLPVMLGVGAVVQRLAGPLRRRLPLASAVALVVLGALTIAGRLGPQLDLTQVTSGLTSSEQPMAACHGASP